MDMTMHEEKMQLNYLLGWSALYYGGRKHYFSNLYHFQDVCL